MENVSAFPRDKAANQVTESLSVHSCPHEDLWHLPGRLRINPSLWDKEDVTHWLHWAHKEYSLKRSEKGCFAMNGRALCLLTKEDFRRRCPSSGDVLYEILQCVKQQRGGVVCHPHNLHMSQNQAEGLDPQGPGSKVNTQDPGLTAVTVSDTQVTTAVSHTEPTSAVTEHSPPLLNPPLHISGVSVPVSTQSKAPPPTEDVTHEPLNLSSRERPRSPLHKVNGRIPQCRLLYNYVYQLLCDDRYQEYIRWEDQDSLVFRVVDPNGLACLWGNHKNRDNMTYEKMSRALRHYYKLNIIKKERGQKLLFRFLKLPQGSGRQQTHPHESPAHAPPPYRDFPDSPTLDIAKEHLEVSPEPSPPHSHLTGEAIR